MTKTFLDWLPDIGFGGCFFLFLAIISVKSLLVIGKPILNQLKEGKPVRIYDIVGLTGTIVFSCLFGSAVISNTRRDHWLRVGTSRYTVATITRSYYSRSGRKFVFVYPAGPRRYQANAECGNTPCPPAGTRRYVRFAAEAPDVCQVTPVPIPDSVRDVPPLGWDRLP